MQQKTKRTTRNVKKEKNSVAWKKWNQAETQIFRKKKRALEMVNIDKYKRLLFFF